MRIRNGIWQLKAGVAPIPQPISRHAVPQKAAAFRRPPNPNNQINPLCQLPLEPTGARLTVVATARASPKFNQQSTRQQGEPMDSMKKFLNRHTSLKLKVIGGNLLFLIR